MQLLGRAYVAGRVNGTCFIRQEATLFRDTKGAGMAGTFGVKRINYAMSMMIGQALFEEAF
jgi:hypothetical protein